MKNGLLLILFILLSFFFSACQTSTADPNKNANIASSPPPTPKQTVSTEEVQKKEKQVKIEQNKAINDFIAKNYKGWKMQGISFLECGAYREPCEIHLVNGNQNKIITVYVKEFFHPDGTSYWFVYEARQIDLAQLKIEQIKDDEREATLENLTTDDCSNICAAQED